MNDGLRFSMHRFIPVTVALVLAVSGAFAIVYSDGGDGDLASASPAASHNITYNASTEELRFLIVRGSYRNQPDATWSVERVKVIQGVGEQNNRDVPVTVRNGSLFSSAGLWYSANGSGVVDHRPRAGDSITIVRDGTDLDDDGISGPEPGETYRITVFGGGRSSIMAKKTVRAKT